MSGSNYDLAKVVQTSYEFTGFVQLNRAFDAAYRRACRLAFLPTETENRIFRAVIRAAQGNLDQGRRNLFLVSPFGTGKSLDLEVIFDIFSSKGNKDALKGFDQAVRSDLLALTSQGPYLVVPVVGTESPLPLSQAILSAFRRAVDAHPLLEAARTDGTFLVQLEYEEAAQWLQRICDGNLRHLRAPLDEYLRRHPSEHTVSSLKKGLDAYDPETLEVWRSSYKEVTGGPPTPYGVATPRDVFDRALPELQAHGVVGIALEIDELSQYLQLYPEFEADAIRTLDPLVHWIHEHEPCFSIVASQTIPEWLQGMTDAGYQAWASLRGRFQILHMDRQRYDQLIARALVRVPSAPTDPDKHPQMQELYEEHMTCFAAYGDDRATAQRAVASYYPFHPTVIAAIGAIADTLGQFERSIFQYLDRSTGGGFKDFIDSHPVYLGDGGPRLTLITLDEIFRYFALDWSKLEGVNDSLAQASRRAEAAIQGSALARRVLDLVSLLGFIEGRVSLPTPTPRGIAEMLNVPANKELEEVLQHFVDEGYFTADETSGYRLMTAGGPRPSEVTGAIQSHVAQDVDPVTGAMIRDYLASYLTLSSSLRVKPAPPFPIQSTYHVTVKNVGQEFKRELATVHQLVERASTLRPGESLAGRLIVGVVSGAGGGDGKQLAQAVAAARKLAEAGAIVALPRQAAEPLVKQVRQFRGAKAVAEDPRLGTSEVARQALEGAQYQLLSALSSQYSASKLDWYTPYGPSTAVNFQEASAAVEAAARKLMEAFPNGIARPDIAGGNSLKDVVRTLLDGGASIELRGKTEDVFVSALQPMGLVAVGPKTKDPKRLISVTEPDIARPELALSAAMWAVVANALPVGDVVSGEALYDALQVLRRPPYWSPENLIVYLLAAYIGKHKGVVKHTDEGGFRKPSVDDIKKLAKPRSGLEVSIPQRTALSVDQTLFVESIAKTVSATLPQGASAYSGSGVDANAPESVLAEVGEDLGRWYRDHGAYAKGLVEHYCMGPKVASALLGAIEEAAASGADRLRAPRLYTHTLMTALGAPSNQAPLTIERLIEGLTEVARARDEIHSAARMHAGNMISAAVWEKFVADCLDKDSRRKLLQALRTLREKAGGTPTEVGVQVMPAPNSSGLETSSEHEEIPDTSVNADELQDFADFVLGIATQVETGQAKVASLEELVSAFRLSRETVAPTA